MNSNNSNIKRDFIVGDSWLFYKVYSGSNTADFVLKEIIYPITQYLLEKQIIDKWFYIRYGDPHRHLRIRFHCVDKKRLFKIIEILHNAFEKYIEDNLIWKIQLDTYKREIERYGIKTMELSETIFFHDSQMQIQFLNLIEGDEGEEIRWLFGLRSIDTLLNAFGYSLGQKLQLIEKLKTSYGKEFGISRFLKKQLDEKYRNKRKAIQSFMQFSSNSKPEMSKLIDLWDDFMGKISPIAKSITKLEDNPKQQSLNWLMSSYIHMLMNRLFMSKNRLNEMVCYDILFRYYKTRIALEKVGKQKKYC